jgi:DNA-directed RNA polymerase subunit RPC12/RpoP
MQQQQQHIQLRDLHHHRAKPLSSLNLRNDSIELLVQDIQQGGGEGDSVVLFDSTPLHCGRDVPSLLEAAKRLGNGAQLAFCSNEPRDFLVAPRAACVSANLLTTLNDPLEIAAADVSSLNLVQVETLQQSVACRSSLAMMVSLPPILLTLPLASRLHHLALDLLASSCVDSSCVIIDNLLVMAEQGEYLRSLLDRGCHLILDGFGLASVWTPLLFNVPSDAAGLAGAAALLRAKPEEFSKRLTLSSGSRGLRTQKLAHGGQGSVLDCTKFLPLLQSLAPAAGSGCGLLFGQSLAAALFTWYVAPPPAPPVEAATVSCHVCGALVVVDSPGHYRKFAFDYCGSQCLAKHRNTGWK